MQNTGWGNLERCWVFYYWGSVSWSPPPAWTSSVAEAKEVSKELWAMSYADRKWNWNIYMPNQISYLASQHRQRQMWSVYSLPFSTVSYWIMRVQYFALLNLILKLQFCGEASLEFPLISLIKQLRARGFNNTWAKTKKTCFMSKKETRPGVDKIKPKGWFKYSLQIDWGVVWDCSIMSLSTWETCI